MVLLLYAIISCLAAYYIVLVSLIFGTAIPISVNILMKYFYTCILFGLKHTFTTLLLIRTLTHF